MRIRKTWTCILWTRKVWTNTLHSPNYFFSDQTAVDQFHLGREGVLPLFSAMMFTACLALALPKPEG
jgi:hypothetical protein